MFLFDLLSVAHNELYVSDNRISIHPAFADYQLFYCCNDFQGNLPNTSMGSATRRSTRHPFPAVGYLPGDQLITALPSRVGALQQDPLDRRWRDSAVSGAIPAVDYGTALAANAFALDFDPQNPPPPLETDNDGMPDAFETANGLYPDVFDANGAQLSVPFTGIAGTRISSVI